MLDFQRSPRGADGCGDIVIGGEAGIRTLGTVTGTPHFECGAFDHSATSPRCFRPKGVLVKGGEHIQGSGGRFKGLRERGRGRQPK